MNITTLSFHPSFISTPQIHNTLTRNGNTITLSSSSRRRRRRVCKIRGSTGEEEEPKRRSFLSIEEAGLVEISGLGAHEKFLCRLTISSLNLLRVIGEQEGCRMEELNAGKICDWFLKDKLKREQDFDSAVLQWDDPDFPF
ncbi:PREDICTED: uncharacterized protein LOC104812675 [Tarenaya hassleriana]|uniref:uncharacterized protein LOC104812675 n=1 Tax=Tarenaya hassleriana TaxID=28532 RepID=UPI00053C13E9|nr:PREDICTED: uncharacterized protein LOC104812675 [Tarenaya hassleriana]